MAGTRIARQCTLVKIHVLARFQGHSMFIYTCQVFCPGPERVGRLLAVTSLVGHREASTAPPASTHAGQAHQSATPTTHNTKSKATGKQNKKRTLHVICDLFDSAYKESAVAFSQVGSSPQKRLSLPILLPDPTCSHLCVEYGWQ